MSKSLIIGTEPQIVYDYQDVLRFGLCFHCQKSLKWNLTKQEKDDRFCSAVCCSTRYSMVPEKIRILASFAFPLEEDEVSPDQDFLNELNAITGKEKKEELDDDDFLKKLKEI